MNGFMKKLWSKIQNDPGFLREANGWLTIFWLANFPPIIALYLLVAPSTFATICLLYLALVSVWANVAGHASAWQAARVEVLAAESEDGLTTEDKQWIKEEVVDGGTTSSGGRE